MAAVVSHPDMDQRTIPALLQALPRAAEGNGRIGGIAVTEIVVHDKNPMLAVCQQEIQKTVMAALKRRHPGPKRLGVLLEQKGANARNVVDGQQGVVVV